MVDSVPEFVKRHAGSPQRRRSSSATMIEPSVGAAKWLPSAIALETAAAITGLACPTHITPKPLWKSRYSLPSTSQTAAPCPRSRYTGHGSARWNCDGTPPGMTARRAREVLARPRRALTELHALARRQLLHTRRIDVLRLRRRRGHARGPPERWEKTGAANRYSARRQNLVRISGLCGVVIIGAGFGGIAAAIELRNHGFGDITILDRAPALGGTWLLNDYPGAACDVPSHLYSFSYATAAHVAAPVLAARRDPRLHPPRRRRARDRPARHAGRRGHPRRPRHALDRHGPGRPHLGGRRADRRHRPAPPHAHPRLPNADAFTATSSTPPSGTTTTT